MRNHSTLIQTRKEKLSPVSNLLAGLFENESQAQEKISLVASENCLSPLARLPFLMDISARYYLDDIRRFGKWCFPGGSFLKKIESEYLVPLLSELTGAKYINVRPISGMNCMLIALAGLTKPGDIIFAIPPGNGGHASTSAIAEQLGLGIYHMPFTNPYDIDLEYVRTMLLKIRPALIYIDQATLLFPLDPKPIRDLIDTVSPETILHYDSSHINGLIMGKALFNPLERGAHIFGGSTHKTLPGPHKGFLATNDPFIAAKIQSKADHFVSHHHPASLISLTITLLEMKYCGGTAMAEKMIKNTKILAETLAEYGFCVAAKERGYTASHQLWACPANEKADDYFDWLTEAGIITNYFDQMPGTQIPGLRISMAEPTRLGATEQHAREIAYIMAELLHVKKARPLIKQKIKLLRRHFATPKFCFHYNDLNASDLPQEAQFFLKNLFSVN